MMFISKEDCVSLPTDACDMTIVCVFFSFCQMAASFWKFVFSNFEFRISHFIREIASCLAMTFNCVFSN